MLYPIQISRVKILGVLYLHYNLESHLNDMEIPETERFIPKAVWIGYNTELAEYSVGIFSIKQRNLVPSVSPLPPLFLAITLYY